MQSAEKCAQEFARKFYDEREGGGRAGNHYEDVTRRCNGGFLITLSFRFCRAENFSPHPLAEIDGGIVEMRNFFLSWT